MAEIDIVQRLVIDASAAQAGADAYLRATQKAQTGADSLATSDEKLTATMDKLTPAFDRVSQSSADMSASMQRAIDGAGASARAANDNYRSFTGGLVDGASSIVATVSHLKLLALGAYALFPAFRGLVNTGAAQAIGVIGPAAGLASTAISGLVSVLGPALSFLSRIALPITLAVAAFKLLSDTISTGSSLLDKYGLAGQRKLFDDPQLASTLEKLTRFQDDTATATLQEQTYAANLSGRLEEANRQIKDFFNVQIDLNGAGLRLQNVWVVIVETIAKAVTLAGNLPQSLKFTNTPASSPTWFLGGRSEADIVRGLNEQNGTAQQTQQTAEQALAIAYTKLAAGMGGGFSGRFNGIVDNTPKATTEINATRDAWDKAITSIEKHTLTLQADTMAVGQSSAVLAQYKAEFQLLEAAKTAGDDKNSSRAKITDDQIASYTSLRGAMSAHQALVAAGINLDDEDAKAFMRVTDAVKAATAANAAAQINNKISFDSQTAFLSPQDVQIAQQLKTIYGNDIPKAMQSMEAAAMRANAALKKIKEQEPSTEPSVLAPAANSNERETAHNERDHRSKAA